MENGVGVLVAIFMSPTAVRKAAHHGLGSRLYLLQKEAHVYLKAIHHVLGAGHLITDKAIWQQRRVELCCVWGWCVWTWSTTVPATHGRMRT